MKRIDRALASLLLAAVATPAFAAPVATFDYVSYRMLGADEPTPKGSYRNPVLPGFQPDPSIVRVGADFYLVNSTFSWFPGLPIYHSTDLVHWKQIGNAIDRTSQVDFSGLGTNRGLFAPAIEYHDGRYWIVNTCIECGGNFVITADRPEGPWSDPVWLEFGGIDPSLVFGDNGEVWIVYNDAPPGEPLYDGHRAIWIQRFDQKAMRMLPERTLLVNGGVDLSEEPVWAEGPHIYLHDGWYYLMAAEGGTADQHSETIYRSRKVEGPYEAGPINPILTQRNLAPDRPDRVEATGHADLVRLDDGSWWGVFLAARPFAGQSTLMGRETYLLPVQWKDGWPTFLEPGETVPPVVKAPKLPHSKGGDWKQWRDDFDAPLSDAWIGLRTPKNADEITVDTAMGKLRLAASTNGASSLERPSFIGRRLRHHDAEFVTRLSAKDVGKGDFAGLLAIMDEAHFLTLGLEGDEIVLRRRAKATDQGRGRFLARSKPVGTTDVELRLQFHGGTVDAAYRPKGSGPWVTIARKVNVEPLASIHAGLFTGLVVGPYAFSGE